MASFDWSEYYHLSKELAGQVKTGSFTDEAKFRCAISRAYYAAFCKARNYLRDNEPESPLPSGVDQHYAVYERFTHSSDRVRRDIGEHLNVLRRYRNDADYTDSFGGLSGKLKEALTRSNSVLNQLSKLR